MPFLDPWFAQPQETPVTGHELPAAGWTSSLGARYLSLLWFAFMGMVCVLAGTSLLLVVGFRIEGIAAAFMLMIIAAMPLHAAQAILAEVLGPLFQTQSGPQTSRSAGVLFRMLTTGLCVLMAWLGYLMFPFHIFTGTTRSAKPLTILPPVDVLWAPPAVLLTFWAFFGIVRETRLIFSSLKKFRCYSLLPVQHPERADGNPWLTVVHWSDLHLTATDDGRRAERGIGGNVALRTIVERDEQLLSQADVILITGDMTDSGSAEEWRSLFEIVPEHLRARCIIFGGNHDLNVTSSTSLSSTEARDRPLRNLRIIRALAALDHFQGDRSWICDEQRNIVPLAAYLAGGQGDMLRQYAAAPVQRRFEYTGRSSVRKGMPVLRDITDPAVAQLVDLPAKVWRQVFPMAVEIPGKETIVIVFDSNEIADDIIGNAYGRIDPEALERKECLLRAFPSYRTLYALHHHVALPRFDEKALERFKARFMTLLNAKQFLDSLKEEQTVVFHGHRHVHFTQVMDNLEIISAPSTTIGDEVFGVEESHYYVYGLAPVGQRGFRVVSKTRRATDHN